MSSHFLRRSAVDGMREQTHGSVEDSSVSIEKSCACTVAKAKRPDWEYSIDATHSGTTYSTVNPLRFAQKLRQDPCKDPGQERQCSSFLFEKMLSYSSQ